MPETYVVSSWGDAEHNAAHWLREWGFLGAKVTPPGSDGGIDVRARGAVAQVKYRAAATGRPDLQRLVGASPAGDELFFFSSGGFSQHAVEYANMQGINLFSYGPDGSVACANSVATSFLAAVERRKEPEAIQVARRVADEVLPRRLAELVSTRGLLSIRKWLGTIFALSGALCLVALVVNAVRAIRGTDPGSIHWWDFPIFVAFMVGFWVVAALVIPDDD